MKLAIITGGSKGLGESLVDTYLENGWQVREFSRSGQSAEHIDCDFSDFAASATIISNTFAELEHHDWSEVILINNVGTLSPIGPIMFSNPQDWHKNLQVNIQSSVTASGLFLKHFSHLAIPKYIANISSGAATNPYFGWSLYCASKAAIEAFTRCVAIEQNDETNPTIALIINPGVIDTDMQQAIRSQSKSDFKDLDKFTQLKDEDRLQTPQSVASEIYSIIDSSPIGGEKYDV